MAAAVRPAAALPAAASLAAAAGESAVDASPRSRNSLNSSNSSGSSGVSSLSESINAVAACCGGVGLEDEREAARDLLRQLKANMGNQRAVSNLTFVAGRELVGEAAHLLLIVYNYAMSCFGPLPQLMHPEPFCELCVKRHQVACKINPAEARKFHRFMLQQGIGNQDARTHLAVAEMHRDAGDVFKAVTTLENAIKVGVESPPHEAEQIHDLLRSLGSSSRKSISYSRKSISHGEDLSPIPEVESSMDVADQRGGEPLQSLELSLLSDTAVTGRGGVGAHAAPVVATVQPAASASSQEGIGVVAAGVSMVASDGELSDVSVSRVDASGGEFGSVPAAKLIRVNGISYTRVRTLGRGGSSKVFLVRTPSGEMRALKRVTSNCPTHFSALSNEVTLLQQLRECPNVINVFDAEVSPERGVINIVMERGEQDLAHLLQSDVELNLGYIQMLWRQMLEAVQVVHKERIIHADLKPGNFLFVDGRLKLIDFGIASKISSETTSVIRDNSMGTVSYMAPESVQQGSRKMGCPADIWSLGIILYQMLYRHVPFAHLDTVQRLFALQDPNVAVTFPPTHRLAGYSESTKESAMDVLQKCLQRNPRQRPLIPQLLEHAFLHDTVTLSRYSFDKAMMALVVSFDKAAKRAVRNSGDEGEHLRTEMETGGDPAEDDAALGPGPGWQAVADELWQALLSSSSQDRGCAAVPANERASAQVTSTEFGLREWEEQFRSWCVRGATKRRRLSGALGKSVAAQSTVTTPPRDRATDRTSGQRQPPRQTARAPPRQTAERQDTSPAERPGSSPAGRRRPLSAKTLGPPPRQTPRPPGPPPPPRHAAAAAGAASSAPSVAAGDAPRMVRVDELQKQRGCLKKVPVGDPAEKCDTGESVRKSWEGAPSTENIVVQRLMARRAIVADDVVDDDPTEVTRWKVAPPGGA